LVLLTMSISIVMARGVCLARPGSRELALMLVAVIVAPGGVGIVVGIDVARSPETSEY